MFHDFWEDAAAILRQYKVRIEQVFDTQIAHRELTKSEGSYSFLDSNISLNCLLEKYLKTQNSMKEKISVEMNMNPELWEQRPLKATMLEYASQDVVYLSSIYNIFKRKLSKYLVSKIFEKSSNWHFYSLINKNHPGIDHCEAGQYVGAYIK